MNNFIRELQAKHSDDNIHATFEKLAMKWEDKADRTNGHSRIERF